jgi:hypothetical protein
MPACQVCISEVAEVTDNDASTQIVSTTNQDVKKYFSRHTDCSLFTSSNVSQRYTRKEKEKMSNQVYG